MMTAKENGADATQRRHIEKAQTVKDFTVITNETQAISPTREMVERFRAEVVDIEDLEGDAAKDDAAAAPLRFLDLIYSSRGIKPILTDDFIIKGVLANGAMSVIYGPSNVGKTFFALDLAYRVAIGKRWHGRLVEPAAVLYLATEGGRLMRNRVAALAKEHGACDEFIVLPSQLSFLAADKAESVSEDVLDVIALAEHVKEMTGRNRLLIVLDTLSRALAGGDENSSVDMTKFVAAVDLIRQETGAHMLIVHHTGKDVARGARGHSSLRAAADTEIELDASNGGKRAVVQKQRDYAGGQVFPFDLKTVELGFDAQHEQMTTCIAEECEAVPADAKVAPDMVREVIEVISSLGGGPLPKATIVNACVAAGKASSTGSKRAIRETIDRAIQSGAVVKIGEEYAIV